MFWISHTVAHQGALFESKDGNNQCIANGLQGGDINTAPATPNYVAIRSLYNAYWQLTVPEGQPDPELPPFAANTYDAVALIALAIERAGALTDRKAIRDGLRAVANYEPGKDTYAAADFGEAVRALRRGEAINYDGASGSIEFDDYGVVANGTVIWGVKACEFENLKTFSEEEMLVVGQASGFCSP
jgi:ABC-type branched-subunit amino acid transport system substrate-binding protein